MCERIRSFYGKRLIENKELEKYGIKYPIQIEYYKIKEKNKVSGNLKYGIEIVKKEFKEKAIKVEVKDVFNIIKEEKRADNILEILKRNMVTPIGLNDVINDLLYESVKL